MRLREIQDILEAEVLVGEEQLDLDIQVVKASDLMSDVLAFTHPGGLLLTGLAYAQAIRTAEVADIRSVIFVRGKRPSPDVLALAAEKGIPVLTTHHSMFVASGRLARKGLFGTTDSRREVSDRKDPRPSTAGAEPSKATFVHSFRIDEEKCTGCVACMRACPTRAIRVRGGKAHAVSERCIDCGECMRVCPHHAILPMTTSLSDLEKFKYTVALPSPVLYGQFWKGTLPTQVLAALKAIAFDEAYDKAWACEITIVALREYLREHPIPGPMISSVCPAVTRLVQIQFPALADRIVPIEPPREIAAKLIRNELAEKLDLSPDDIGIIHITPCSAKMISINNPITKEKSYLDGAISITEVYADLRQSVRNMPEGEPFSACGVGIGLAVSGGEAVALGLEDSLAVSGVQETIRVLEEAEAGRLENIRYLECQICPDGCIGGPLNVQSRWLAKNNIFHLTQVYGMESGVDEDEVRTLYEQHSFDFEKSITPAPMPPLDKVPSVAIGKVQERERIARLLPGKNCGACGAPDCWALAEDVVRGVGKLEECVFMSEGDL
jgi:Na+-translocating ferredoxin:NAD+ oxidoreductase RNF subunit RnfB